ncbi:MAG: NADH-quinone oxidoreductase subunit L [Fimbriimonadaceae bacterium]
MSEGTKQLIWLVLFLPLLGSIIQALFGGRVVAMLGPKKGKWTMGLLAVAPIALSFVLGAKVTMDLIAMNEHHRLEIVTLFEWIRVFGLSIPFELRIDPLSMTMVLIITGIGSLIHLYATGYMAEDRDYPRFFTYLNLFVAFMLVLVLGNNLPLLFIGWEGVGLCSYLLIGYWYKDLANSRAANKAFIVNRIGDWGLMLGMALLLVTFAVNRHLLGGDTERFLSYDVILPNAMAVLGDKPAIATAIALLLFVGAMGKSAQFPLYLWLPDAMAGPTPVSALIHAATMVTAGVFLLNRMAVIFELSPTARAVVMVIGCFTAIFAALIAFGQTDIKKVLAYSTVSQLGFMFMGCGAAGFWTGMFHVTTHAFFKALLFLGSGAVIYAMAHDQDMRNYGNLRKYLPWTCWTMVIGTIAIAGLAIPPGLGFAGFYSKEAILGALFGNKAATYDGYSLGVTIGWVALFGAMLTAWYMFRMTMLTFFGKEERWRLIPAHAGHHAHHDDHHDHHADHHDHAHHDHGPDEHRFFMTAEEQERREASEHDDHHHAHLDESFTPKEAPISMILPLVVLAVLSIGGGYFLYQGHLFEHWLYPDGLATISKEYVYGHPKDMPIDLLYLSIIAASLGTLLGLLFYWKGLPAKEGWDMSKWNPFRRAALHQFGYDEAMVTASVEGGDELAGILYRDVDVGMIDRTVNGVAAVTGGLAKVLRVFQTGYARGYALMMLLGSVALVAYLVYMLTRGGGAN